MKQRLMMDTSINYLLVFIRTLKIWIRHHDTIDTFEEIWRGECIRIDRKWYHDTLKKIKLGKL